MKRQVIASVAVLMTLLAGCSNDPKIDKKAFVKAVVDSQRESLQKTIDEVGAADGKKIDAAPVLDFLANCLYDNNLDSNPELLQDVVKGDTAAVSKLLKISEKACLTLDALPTVGS